MYKPLFHWLAVITLTLVMVGCVTPPKPTLPPERQPEPTNPEETASYWYQRTNTEQTASGNFQVIKTRPQTERWPGEDISWLLRSYKGKNQQIVHQLWRIKA